mgnify:CR=1 FL=1
MLAIRLQAIDTTLAAIGTRSSPDGVEDGRGNTCGRIADEADRIEAQRRCGCFGIGGKELTALEQEPGDRRGEDGEPECRRHVHRHHQSETTRHRFANGSRIVDCSVSAPPGKHRRRN